jgi:hypothetical protein
LYAFAIRWLISNGCKRKDKPGLGYWWVLEAQSGRLPFVSQRNTERRQSAMRPRLFWLSVHGGQRQVRWRQSATCHGLVGCLSVGSQRWVVCNGCCRRKGISSPWLRHRDLVCLAGFVRGLWRKGLLWSGQVAASGVRWFKLAARTRPCSGLTVQAFGGRCLQGLEARNNQATVIGIRPQGAGKGRSKNRGSKCSKAQESGCLPCEQSWHMRASLTIRCTRTPTASLLVPFAFGYGAGELWR